MILKFNRLLPVPQWQWPEVISALLTHMIWFWSQVENYIHNGKRATATTTKKSDDLTWSSPLINTSDEIAANYKEIRPGRTRRKWGFSTISCRCFLEVAVTSVNLIGLTFQPLYYPMPAQCPIRGSNFLMLGLLRVQLYHLFGWQTEG